MNSKVQTSAVEYAQMGLLPVPLWGIGSDGKCMCRSPSCRAAGKHPMGKGWNAKATADVDVVRDKFRDHHGNIGIALNNRLVLIDADGDDGLATVNSWNPPLPLTMQSRSGSGNGGHWIYRVAPHQDANLVTDRSKFEAGVDVKVRGQFVVYPSMHASGRTYEWINFTEPALLPDWLYERIKAPNRAPAAPVARPRSTGDAATWMKRLRAYIPRKDASVQGSGGSNKLMGVAGLVAAHGQWLSRGDMMTLLEEYNETLCDPPWTARELEHKLDDALAKPLQQPLPDREPQIIAKRAPVLHSVPTAPDEPPDVPDEDWRSKCIYVSTRDGGTKLMRTLDNAIVILQNDPAWRGKIRLDTFAQQVKVAAPPWADYLAARDHEGVWKDSDTARLQAWMVREYGLELACTDLDRAVTLTAENNAHSSARDWFDALAWDGTPRVNTWLTSYLGAAETPYTTAVGRWWLLSAVARVYAPGCKADHVLILEGAQGIGKSSALRALAGEPWFCDTAFDISSKDAYLSIQGRLVIELAELDSLKRSDADRAKAFFTSPVDKYRAPYDRRMVSMPRQCVFAGTTNNREMLKDDTGNRRYWPVSCSRSDAEGIARDRAQLWAEALVMYRAGQAWHPRTAEERGWCEEAQEEHHVKDSREDLINEWATRNGITKTTLAEVFERVFKLEPDKWTKGTQGDMASVMKRAGWCAINDRNYDATRTMKRYYTRLIRGGVVSEIPEELQWD